MILRTLGKDSDLKRIWRGIKSPDGSGGYFTKVSDLTSYFLKKNLYATAVVAKDPIAVARVAYENGIYTVFNLSDEKQLDCGHLTVLSEVTEQGFLIHDPNKGKSIPYTEASLRFRLTTFGEATPNTLVLISASRFNGDNCISCGATFPNLYRCRHCNNEYQPSHTDIKGCPSEGCDLHSWLGAICPSCNLGPLQLIRVSG